MRFLDQAVRPLADWAGSHGLRPASVVGAGPGMGLRLLAPLGSASLREGTYERPVQDALQTVLRPGEVFFDIGANCGFLSLIAARQVGAAGHVYAFEPVPRNLRYLRRNMARNDNPPITVIPAAVSDRAGEARLQLARHPGGATLDAEPPPDLAGTLTVPTVSLDGLLEAGRVRPPDWVKIDVEGAELVVLAGMEATIQHHHPNLLVELDAATSDLLAAKRALLLEVLRRHHYRIEPLAPSYPGASWAVEHLLARFEPAE